MSKGRNLSFMLVAGAVAAALYLYSKSAAAQAAGAAASLAPAGTASGSAPGAFTVPVLPGSSAPVMSQLATAQSLWSSLTPTSPPSSGYINLPSGTQVPAAEFTAGNAAMDQNGNVYVLWGGQIYALAFPDASGNWPATLYSGS